MQARAADDFTYGNQLAALTLHGSGIFSSGGRPRLRFLGMSYCPRELTCHTLGRYRRNTLGHGVDQPLAHRQPLVVIHFG